MEEYLVYFWIMMAVVAAILIALIYIMFRQKIISSSMNPDMDIDCAKVTDKETTGDLEILDVNTDI